VFTDSTWPVTEMVLSLLKEGISTRTSIGIAFSEDVALSEEDEHELAEIVITASKNKALFFVIFMTSILFLAVWCS
jgi:hypothetical protein